MDYFIRFNRECVSSDLHLYDIIFGPLIVTGLSCFPAYREYYFIIHSFALVDFGFVCKKKNRLKMLYDVMEKKLEEKCSHSSYIRDNLGRLVALGNIDNEG